MVTVPACMEDGPAPSSAQGVYVLDSVGHMGIDMVCIMTLIVIMLRRFLLMPVCRIEKVPQLCCTQVVMSWCLNTKAL